MNKRNSFKTFAATLMLLLPIQLTGSAHAEDHMKNAVVEIVTFKLAKGVAEKDFLKAGEAATIFIKARKGFVSRKLTRNADGVYMDHVTWTSLEEAQKSMEASMQEANLGPFMQAIDPTSMKVEHQVLLSTEN